MKREAKRTMGRALTWVGLFFLLLACSTGGTGGGGWSGGLKKCSDPCDQDGDGYKVKSTQCMWMNRTGVYDCNDLTPLVHPNAAEACDGLENNCDGKMLAGEVTDSDQDGYLGCDDCADDDPLAYPGAPELCDGVLNNCDGQMLEGEQADADGDGHLGCGDCDENDNFVYPGAAE